ncbi:bifunctional metallophosphatase/5'-nucleotidase [Hahella ganghwensis]|uniref:bifunctional metallophosphatase/5'-nucleotidase n=1 Tax=Hahella ganghwensis TaxID=286420 RepID=UPI000368573C|nr:bifunctional metallophosphatase/5'-nucleotidase [Hahella ganghwensis]
MPKKSGLWLFFTILFALPVSAKVVNITLVQANDVYEMTPVNGGLYGGLARLQSLINQLKRENPNTFTVLAGDLFSPSAIGTAKVDGERLNGKQMVAVLNAMDWDFMTLGNHEFDNGLEPMLDRLDEAQFKIITSNVLDASNGKLFPNTQETLVLKVEGIKVGLAGITLRSLAKDFVTIEDPLKEAQRAVNQLKNQDKADILVLITHQDLAEDIKFAEKLTNVDLILGGHEHENAYLRRGIEFTPIAKADANARSVYIHHLAYDTLSKSLSINSRLQIIDARFDEDPVIAEVVDKWINKAFTAFRNDGFEPEQLVAITSEPLDGLEASVRNGETRLTSLVAESALAAYPGSDLSLLNAGSIRIDDILPPGDVTQYDVIRILPFGGDYSQVRMPGDILEQALNVGEANRGKGGFLHHAKVEMTSSGWSINGVPLNTSSEYTVSIANFLIDRGDSGLEFLVDNHRIKRISDGLVDSRFALIDELKSTYPAQSTDVTKNSARSPYIYAE